MQKERTVQINGLIKTDGKDNITEKSLLINIYGDNILQALAQFNMLKKKINADISFLPSPESDDEIKVQNIPFDDPEDDETPNCPRCGEVMVRRRSKDGNQFWGCSNFRATGCRGSRPIFN